MLFSPSLRYQLYFRTVQFLYRNALHQSHLRLQVFNVIVEESRIAKTSPFVVCNEFQGPIFHKDIMDKRKEWIGIDGAAGFRVGVSQHVGRFHTISYVSAVDTIQFMAVTHRPSIRNVSTRLNVMRIRDGFKMHVFASRKRLDLGGGVADRFLEYGRQGQEGSIHHLLQVFLNLEMLMRSWEGIITRRRWWNDDFLDASVLDLILGGCRYLRYLLC